MSTFLVLLFVSLVIAAIASFLTPDEKYKKRSKHHWWQDDPNRLVKCNGKYYRVKDTSYYPCGNIPNHDAKPVNIDEDL